MKIEEITRSESASAMVEALMARRNTPQPETVKLKEQYDPRGHRIFDTSERPDKIVRGENGEIERFEKVARIALPLQQVIVERAVAFLFGHPVLVLSLIHISRISYPKANKKRGLSARAFCLPAHLPKPGK